MVTFDTTYFTRLSAWITAIVLIFCFIPQVNAQNGDGDDLLKFEIGNPDTQDAGFGQLVAIDGDHAVIASDSKIYFYYFDGNSWDVVFEADAKAEASSIAIDDGVVAVGYPNMELAFLSGSVDVFRLVEGNDGEIQWMFDQQLGSLSGNFGYNVAVKNGLIAVSNPNIQFRNNSTT